MPDVIVVGAGVVGAAVADALVAAGATVCVLEAGEVAGATSAATFAADISHIKTPRALYELSMASGREHRALARVTGVSWRHPVPVLEWHSSREGLQRIRERSRRLRSWGHAVELISTDSARDMEPGLELPAGIEAVAFYPDEAWYEPRVLVRALLDRASAGGVRVRIHDPVTAMKSARGRVTELETASGHRFSADWIVLCAGSQAGEVAGLAGAQLRLQRVPGLIMTTTPAPTGLGTIVSADDLNIRPERSGRLVAHSWMTDGQLGPGPPWDNAATLADGLLRRAQIVLPGLTGARVESASVAVRPVPLDGLPLVGVLPEAENLYVVASHSAVHLAPILGRLTARELTGTHEPALDLFRPTRERTQEPREAIDESTRRMLAQILTA